jgi:hypothetical protein
MRPSPNRRNKRGRRILSAKIGLLDHRVKDQATGAPIIAPINVAAVDQAVDRAGIEALIVVAIVAIAAKADVPAVDVLSTAPPTSSSKS